MISSTTDDPYQHTLLVHIFKRRKRRTSKMKVNPAPLHLAQLIITGLVVALSIAILGTSAHTLDVYNKQQSTNPWWMLMWPEHFDTQGTKALLASAVVTFVLSAVFLVLSVIPKVSPRQFKYEDQCLQSGSSPFVKNTPSELSSPSARFCHASSSRSSPSCGHTSSTATRQIATPFRPGPAGTRATNRWLKT